MVVCIKVNYTEFTVIKIIIYRTAAETITCGNAGNAKSFGNVHYKVNEFVFCRVIPLVNADSCIEGLTVIIGNLCRETECSLGFTEHDLIFFSKRNVGHIVKRGFSLYKTVICNKRIASLIGSHTVCPGIYNVFESTLIL